MSITKTRNQRMKARAKRKHRIIGTTYGIGLLGVGIAALVMAMSIGHLYTSTKHWGDGQKGPKMATVNPEYVSNYPTNDTKQLRQVSSELTQVLTQTTVDKLPTNTKEVIQRAKKLIQELKIENGQLVQDVKRLEQYQAIIDFLQTAYTKPDTAKLRTLANQVQTELLNHGYALDEAFMKKLQQVNQHYITYNEVIGMLNQYGTLKEGIYTIPLDSPSLTPLMKKLASISMFPGMKAIETQLKANEHQIYQNRKQNEEQVTYYTFKALLKRIEGIYVQVSSVKTYQDVIKNGWSVEGTYLPDDKVEALRVDGQVLQPTDWIKLSVKPEVIMQEKVMMTPQTTAEVETTNETKEETPDTSNEENRTNRATTETTTSSETPSDTTNASNTTIE